MQDICMNNTYNEVIMEKNDFINFDVLIHLWSGWCWFSIGLSYFIWPAAYSRFILVLQIIIYSVTFLWDGLMHFHGTESKLFIIYVVMDLRVAILRFSCISIFSMIKTLKIQKNGKNYCKKISFWHEKNIYTWKS